MSTDIRPASAAAPTVTRVLRTVGAVIGGAPQPLWFMLASVGYGMVFAGLGGVAAARLAPTRPLVHAAAWLSPWRWVLACHSHSARLPAQRGHNGPR